MSLIKDNSFYAEKNLNYKIDKKDYCLKVEIRGTKEEMQNLQKIIIGSVV
jgi:hypothetical protein